MSELVASLVLRLVDQWSGGARAAQRGLGGLAAAAAATGRAGSVASAYAERLARSTTAGGAAAAAAARSQAALGASTRLVAGALASSTTVARVTAQAHLGGAGAAIVNGQALGTLGRTAVSAAEASGRMNLAKTAETRSLDAATRAAQAQTTAQEAGARAVLGSGAAAESAARRFNVFERAQQRGAAASRMMRGELGRLDRQLATLSHATIVGDGLARAGGRAAGMFGSAATASASWDRTLRGIQIMTQSPARNMPQIGAGIMSNAQAVAMPWERSAGITGAVLNEGAYRSLVEQNQAARSVLKLSQLADITNDPMSDQEAGALTSALAYSLGAPARALDRQMAMMFKGAQLGGVRTGTMARYMPTVLGGVAAMGDRSDLGLATTIAGMQIVKRRAGTDDQAAEYF